MTLENLSPDDSLAAFADESIRIAATKPMYLIGASIVPEGSDLTPLEAILPKGAKKLHWRDLGTKAQRRALSIIAELDTHSTIFVVSPIDPKKNRNAHEESFLKP